MAALVFLQVSPVDLVVLVPLMLAFSAAVPQGHRFAITIPTFRAGPSSDGWQAWRSPPCWCGPWWQESLSTGRMRRSANPCAPPTPVWRCGPASWRPRFRSTRRWQGGLLWRQGLVEQNKEMVNRGEAVLRRGLTADPASVTLRAELARLFSSTTRPEQAVDQCRQGLAFSPHYPILQGLWGYSALVAFQDLRQAELSDRLAAELEDLPVDSPDGWHWLGRTRSARETPRRRPPPTPRPPNWRRSLPMRFTNDGSKPAGRGAGGAQRFPAGRRPWTPSAVRPVLFALILGGASILVAVGFIPAVARAVPHGEVAGSGYVRAPGLHPDTPRGRPRDARDDPVGSVASTPLAERGSIVVGVSPSTCWPIRRTTASS